MQVILKGWTLTATNDGIELTAPGGYKIDLMRLEMKVGDDATIIVRAEKVKK